MSLRNSGAILEATSPKANKPVTKVDWDKDGEGLATFEGGSEIPSDEDIRYLIRRVGKDPEDYNWEITSVSWNSAAWHRDQDGIGLNHTAYTKPSCVVKIRIDPKVAYIDGAIPWPVVQPCKPFVVRHRPAKVVKRTGDFKKAVVLPDMQIGFYFDADGEMQPTHDDRAIDVAYQIIKYIKPDLLIFNGDNLDFPEMSKYRLTKAFAQTTQASVDRAGLLAAESREAVGPDGEIRWLEGNHEIRLSNYIIDNAASAFGLKKANAVPAEWPVMSVPNLCRFDEHGIQYIAGYPANETWINERLRVIHGTHVVSGGSTAHKYLNNDRVSTIYGHIHRREWAERTRAGFGGPQTILAMSAGCLARIDGSVPSTKGGTDLNGVPVSVVEDWQQGLAVVTYREGNGEFIPEQVPIWDGWAIYHGKHFYADEPAAA